MNPRAFEDALHELWDGDPAVADHPRDRRFRDVIAATKGMATENKLALLNAAGRLLAPDEIYLEAGTYTGASLIGAAIGNAGRFIGVDDFSQFDGTEQACRKHLADFGVSNAELVVGDFWSFVEKYDGPPLGVYFYDGAHGYRDQCRAVTAVLPFLANEALIFIDDASHPPVRAANRWLEQAVPGLRRLCSFPSARNGEPKWWNGVDVFAFDRSRSGPVGPPNRRDALRYGPVYDAGRTAMHTAVAGARRLRRRLPR